MKKFFLISKCFVLLVIVLILLTNIYVIIQQLFFRNPTPEFFGYSFVVQKSYNETSKISGGDLFIVKESEIYKEGDTITYIQEDNEAMTGTILKIHDNIVIVKTADNISDIFTVGYIVGKVEKVIPNIGNIINWLKSPFGIIIVLLLGMVIIEAPYYIQQFIQRKKKKIAIDFLD